MNLPYGFSKQIDAKFHLAPERMTPAGLASSFDVEQAVSAGEQTRAPIPVLETNRVEARRNFAVLTGQAPGAFQGAPPKMFRFRCSTAAPLRVAIKMVAARFLGHSRL